MEEICDSKAKPGVNHLESNVAKGLQDASTLAELAAMALYGVSVSWPYLSQARGDGSKIVNLLDLTELHRKLPTFCNHIALHPTLLLDSNAPLDEVTLDGKPFMDKMLLAAVCMLAPDLPGLTCMISAMFSGAAKGWVQFTTEFTVGGPFDSLTPAERALVFIPSTNDANEGALGSWRVHARSRPSSTASTFSSQARSERNNTEEFIVKCCNEDDQGGENAQFREELVENQRERAVQYRKKQEEDQRKKDREKERLRSIGLITDRDEIHRMTVAQLKDQIDIHRKLFNDEILLNTTQKSLPNKIMKMYAVLAAVTRNSDWYVLVEAPISFMLSDLAQLLLSLADNQLDLGNTHANTVEDTLIHDTPDLDTIMDDVNTNIGLEADYDIDMY
ncbi:hypothetical protein SCP_1600270 [Sparassis crispa]|uniref:Uncharacterized protein n=1 Tax=Sparassis crispa TaxID=139825 RepID=A0A401H4J4_9APHY|nr:hypothetical protein SCP_1600270 [Sparassis crispa]GBE89366.1 hypothetical protein SCP_1600270 [Sparassis crispa]